MNLRALLVIATLTITALISGTLWAPPLGAPLTVERYFDPPATRYGAGHRGIDLPTTPDSDLHSPTAGTVSFAGRVADRPVISIRVDDRTVVSLEPVTSELSEGDPVTKGQLIGSVSEGGHCATQCLHLGVRVDGEYVNPLRYFRGKAVLLPWLVSQ